jgi:hypothetical protein
MDADLEAEIVTPSCGLNHSAQLSALVTIET